MYMGSKEKFLKEFGNNLSMRWCTSGYYERSHIDNAQNTILSRHRNEEYRALVEEYGEENADYIWQTMHPEIETPEAAYIKIEGYEVPGSEDGFRKWVKSQGKTLRVLEGDISYLQAMINGPWDDERFLTINPGEKISAVYDMDRVVTTGL